MKNGGGHFAPKLGGHFELESGGHFKLELGGQYHWNLQFMKYEVLKKTGFLDKKWEELLEKAFIDFKKPHYSWLIGRCYTKEERLYAEKIYNEWEKKFLQRFKKVDNVIYI